VTVPPHKPESPDSSVPNTAKMFEDLFSGIHLQNKEEKQLFNLFTIVSSECGAHKHVIDLKTNFIEENYLSFQTNK
jgi:hypothetical protein